MNITNEELDGIEKRSAKAHTPKAGATTKRLVARCREANAMEADLVRLRGIETRAIDARDFAAKTLAANPAQQFEPNALAEFLASIVDGVARKHPKSMTDVRSQMMIDRFRGSHPIAIASPSFSDTPVKLTP